MALSPAQQHMIDMNLDVYLTFSDDPKQFTTEVAELTRCLSQEASESNPFFFLAKYLYEPQTTLLRLEGQGSPVKIGEVQEYILRHITDKINSQASKINKAAKKILVDANKLLWKNTTIAIPAINYQLTFKSDQTAVRQSVHDEGEIEIENLYRINIEPEKIYTAELWPNFDFAIFNLKVVIQFSPEQTHVENTIHIDDMQSFISQTAEDEYIDAVKEKAKKIANTVAARYVLSELRKDIPIDPRMGPTLISSPCNKLLTHRFYFNLFKKKVLSLSQITFFSDNEIESLLHPTAISLIEKKMSEIDIVKTFTLSGLNILSNYFYFQLSKTDNHLLNFFGTLNEDQARLFLLPPIITMLRLKVINIEEVKELPTFVSLEEARRLPVSTKDDQPLPNDVGPLLQKYSQFFIKEAKANRRPNWGKMKELTQRNCQLFLESHIYHLTSENIIPFDELISCINSHLVKALKGKKLQWLFAEKKIDLDHLNHLNLLNRPDKITKMMDNLSLLESHSHLCEWIKQDVLELSDIEADDLLFLFSRIYSRRLYAIFKDTPYCLYGEKDRVDRLMVELPDVAESCNIKLAELQHEIMDLIAIKLGVIIDLELENTQSSFEKKIYLQFRNQITAATADRHINWLDFFCKLASSADLVLRKLSTNKCLRPNFEKKAHNENRLFNKNKSEKPSENELEKLCRMIKSIDCFFQKNFIANHSKRIKIKQ